MQSRYKHNHGPHHGHGSRGSGPTSFWMHDPDIVFNELALQEGSIFLDLGCGPGDYAIRAAKILGGSGLVYALDIDKKMTDDLMKKAAQEGLDNIKAMVTDVTGQLPIEDGCVDVCLMATVLHAINLEKNGEGLFTQIHRVLKSNGRLAIIECKKEDRPWGPPKHIRLSPGQIEDSIKKYGFEKIKIADLGYNYIIQFGIK